MRRVATSKTFAGVCLLGFGLLFCGALVLNAQLRPKLPYPGQGTLPNRNAGQAGGETHVVIEREPAVLIAPKAYQVALALDPAKRVQLAAVEDGVIRRIQCGIGKPLAAEAEALRIDDRALQLKLERAKANFRAAEIELRRAQTGKDADLIEIAEAKQQAAKAELDLGEFEAGQAIVRAPFDGVVLRVNVIAGEWVRAGQPLAELADVTKLKVEIPVDRQDENSAQGKTVELKIEDAVVEGTIEHVLPPAERFQPLRDIVDSVASAIVVLDNAGGKYAVGQTVHSPLIPRHPVCEVAKSSLKTHPDGGWKLQVIRTGVVHDVAVTALGRVGEDRMYVSGPFAQGDEVITKTSKELPSGTQVAQDPRANPQFSRPGVPVRLPGKFDDDDDPS